MKTSLWLCSLVVLVGCDSQGNVLQTDDGGAGDLSGDLSGVADVDMAGFIGIPTADGGIVVHTDGGDVLCYITPCQGKLYACGNCKDDDGDGLVDSQDPDCLGPCQNNEAGFFGNIPGQNNAPCKSDCYWDQDTGSGNDGCNWSHHCDPHEGDVPTATSPEISCNYDPNAKVPGASVPGGQKDCAYLLSNQTTQCTNFCAPLTPNGCDCFGCCENPNAPGSFIWAGSVNAAGTPTCDAKPATLADPTKCKACTPVAGSCYKPCGHCQLCFGKSQLPADCYAPVDGGSTSNTDGGAPPPQTCPTDAPACGLPGQPVCAPGSYCISGCCTSVIF